MIDSKLHTLYLLHWYLYRIDIINPSVPYRCRLIRGGVRARARGGDRLKSGCPSSYKLKKVEYAVKRSSILTATTTPPVLIHHLLTKRSSATTMRSQQKTSWRSIIERARENMAFFGGNSDHRPTTAQVNDGDLWLTLFSPLTLILVASA
jgi:hypothetical protein